MDTKMYIRDHKISFENDLKMFESIENGCIFCIYKTIKTFLKI
jgi:hypothetical protein